MTQSKKSVYSINAAVGAAHAKHHNEDWFISSHKDVEGVVMKVREDCPFDTHRPILGHKVRIERV